MQLSERTAVRNRGFTLIELMVALVLGLVVVGGVMGVFMSTYQANSQNIKAVRLNEEMRAVVSMLSRDVRRAGGKAIDWTTTAWPTTANPLSTANSWVISNMTGAPANSCLRLAYSASLTGSVDSNRFGFRLNPGNGQVEAYNHNAGQWSCNGTNWQPLSDPNIAWIQSLNFTVTTEPGLTGVAVRTVIVNLRAGTHTRSTTPSTLTAAQCSNVDVVCRQIQEKIRVRNDAVL
jgi:prepilin-type N-terminal cleavage/methylation domain-containing protein